MSIMIEGTYLGDLVKRESDLGNEYSREKVTILASNVLALGEVVGKITKSTPTTGTADAGNSGNGTCGAVTAGAKAQIGTYRLTCIAAAGNAGTFQVQTPSGEILPPATVAVAYAGPHINFTLNDGSADFIVGDIFTIAVAAGSGKIVPVNFSAVDGSQDAYGFAIQDYAAGFLRSVAYAGGGTQEVFPGDLLIGATSGAHATVQSLTLTGGTWAGGDAAGALYLENQVGTFEAENLNISATSLNVATIGGNSSAYSPDRYGVAIVRDAVIDSSFLVWPAGATAAQKAAALAQLKALGILSDRPAA